jgi:hypothetical protein
MTKPRFAGCLGLVAALAMGLAACGTGEAASPAHPSGTATRPRAGAGSPAGAAAAVHTVKLEVLGKGKALNPIGYNIDDSGIAKDVTLPWSKTAKVALTSAERRVGLLISVVSGSYRGSDGQFKPTPCRILVDGVKVVSGKGTCEYQLK